MASYMSKASQIAQQYTQDQFWKVFDKLPEKIQDALLSSQTFDTVNAIAKSNGVPNRATRIIYYVDLILMGIVPITLLRETIQEESGIREELARKIATEIRDKIFMPVAEELRQIHGLK